MTDEYRAHLGFAIAFANGGGLQGQGFRLDLPRTPRYQGGDARRPRAQRQRGVPGHRLEPAVRHARLWHRLAFSRGGRRALPRGRVDAGVSLVGIDALNIDDTESGGERPAHSILLAAGVHVVERLTALDRLRARGARFTAAPPAIRGFGAFPVRAFATVPTSH